MKSTDLTSLFLRNLFFTILQPGIVAGLIPFLILGNEFRKIFVLPGNLIGYVGMILIVIGVIILFYCISMFAIKGRGTLSPLDPTKKLVTTGIYKYSRNPMYISVVLILFGESLVTGSGLMYIYTATIFILLNAFIIFHEEPGLRKVFNGEYKLYCEKVRRWV